MSVVEDVRKAMQDFLAPELGELKAGMKALNNRLDALEKHIDSRFTSLELMLHLNERVARLEERESQKGKEQ